MSNKKLTVKKDQEYAVVNRSVFLDDDLSWEAKGIMAYLYCLPDDEKINLEELIKRDKYNALYIVNAIGELRDRGMIK